jgi:hypothetical protein
MIFAAQPVAGADLAVENPFEAGLALAALQFTFGDTASAARRLSSTDEPKRSAAEFRLIGCGWRRLLDLNAEGGLARDPAHGTSAITRLAPPNCALRCAQRATSPTAPVRQRSKE